MNPLTERLDQLSRSMRRHAEAGDWEALGAALTGRDDLLRELVAETRDRSTLAMLLAGMLDETRELLDLAREARDQAASELRHIEAGRRAVTAYGGSPAGAGRRELATRAAGESIEA